MAEEREACKRRALYESFNSVSLVASAGAGLSPSSCFDEFHDRCLHFGLGFAPVSSFLFPCSSGHSLGA
jgi:hypothetical protein